MQHGNVVSERTSAGLAPDEVRARTRQLLASLVRGTELGDTVVAALAIVDGDPLASGGAFRGDIVRGLMEVPGTFWGRHPQLYRRYLHAVRACATARRSLPPSERMEFWCAFDITTPAAQAASNPSPTGR